MTNLDSILKSRDITLLMKIHIVKAMVFPVVMYGYESWTIKKAEHQRTDAFQLWCWRSVLRVPWTTRRSNKSTLKEINPEYSLEEAFLVAQMVKNLLAMQKTWVQSPGWEELLVKGMPPTPVFLPGESHGQKSLVSYSPWGCKELDTTEQLTQHLLEGLRLKLQYFGYLMRRADSLEKTLMLGKIEGRRRRGRQRMRSLDGIINSREFKQTLGNSEGQGSLACCSPLGHKESDMTE